MIKKRTSLKRIMFPVSYVPEIYRSEFEESIDAINISRGKVTAKAFIVVELMILVLTYAFKGKAIFKVPELYYLLMYVLMLIFMPIFLRIFCDLQKNIAGNRRKTQTTGMFFTEFILIWCAILSLIDLKNSGQIMVYTVAVICIAVAPLLKPVTMLLVYYPVHAAFVILMIMFRRSDTIPFGNIVNSTGFVIIAWAISTMRYNKYAYEFRGQKVIEEKNMQLEKINLELRQANKKLEILSQTDGLTGILNRTMFDFIIRREWDRCLRQFKTISLIMADIDFFKAFNDNYGHQAGDNCIRQVAGVLASCAERASDYVARYGGEEFAVILPGTEHDDALALAELMRKRVEALDIPHAFSNVSGHLTISLGVYSVVPSAEFSVEMLIRNADKSLYEAKKQHNKAVVFNQLLDARLK